MHAALYTGAHRLQLIEKPVRKIEKDEVLLKVSACGVCGTDLKILGGKSHANPPVVLGHEFGGIVVEHGQDVRTLMPGNFVAVDPNIACGYCRFCRRGKVNLCENLQALGVDIDGGFAEYCLAPAKQCYRLPDDFPSLHAALLEPLSCALYGIRQANIQPGNSIIIIGGGMIGVIMIQLAKLSGASLIIVTEVDEHRKELAKQFGADLVINPQKLDAEKVIFNATGGGGDVVIECVGLPQTVQQAIRLAANGGTVVVFGVSPNDQTINVAPYEIYRKNLDIKGSFLNPFTFQDAVQLMISKKLRFDGLEIGCFSLQEIEKAFENQRQKKNLKTIILPHE